MSPALNGFNIKTLDPFTPSALPNRESDLPSPEDLCWLAGRLGRQRTCLQSLSSSAVFIRSCKTMVHNVGKIKPSELKLLPGSFSMNSDIRTPHQDLHPSSTLFFDLEQNQLIVS
ncbi:hypothetical protein CRENBAI_023813 [Crenichthys baileyi]|uniref:Uncharacterized protein n=1 Tax=Crenichthys baileyi TaxID=28760 RepID=A0AAV9S9N2_9TELE